MKKRPGLDLAPPPAVKSQATPKNIKHVLLAWSGQDDWGVNRVYTEMAFQLIEALEAGDSPTLLAEHADHFMDDCLREGCKTLLTYEGAPR